MHVLSGYPLFTCHQQWFFSQQTSQGSDRTSPCRSTSKGPLSSNKRTNFSWQLQTKDLTGRADTSGSKNWFRCDWKVMKIWGLYIYMDPWSKTFLDTANCGWFQYIDSLTQAMKESIQSSQARTRHSSRKIVSRNRCSLFLRQGVNKTLNWIILIYYLEPCCIATFDKPILSLCFSMAHQMNIPGRKNTSILRGMLWPNLKFI